MGIYPKLGIGASLGSALYGFSLYMCKSSMQEYQDAKDEFRDSTRLGNKSYGLNYGYKTDSTVI